ncbi:hypothetical protein [Microbacterium sp. CH12i]|uniref:hypothetical protein n=1 Tax=Microbacterium sp. CH12i TaxID=1479651 RepID=UPI00126946D6|nr:hypothetical protein [Microbacterium sp. CH12i]
MTDGSRIPGGPYTLTQVGFGGVALMLLMMTRTLWSTGATLLDLALTVGVAWGVTWVVGLIPMTRRNLVLAFVDAAAAMLKPHGGRYQERTIRLNRPHQAIGATLMPTPMSESKPAEEPDIMPALASTPELISLEQQATTAPIPATHSSQAPARTAVSAVERLLQQTKNNH